MPRRRKSAENTAAPKKPAAKGKQVRVRRETGLRVQGELEATLNHARKNYGAAVVKSGRQVIQPDRISTGVFILDLALLGGIPHNRCSMLVGDRHAGKSMLSSKIIRGAQIAMPNQRAVLLDVEGTFESSWAEQLGVNVDELIVAECETGEMGVDIADAVVQSRETSLLVIDSLAALVPFKEIDSSAEDSHVGIHARLIGSMIRKVTASLIKERHRGHYVTVLFLNQFRSKIGGFNPGFGEPKSIPGGRALEHSTSVQIQIKNKENKGKQQDGVASMAYNEHPYTITKNKVNNGPRTGEFTLVRESQDSTGLEPGEVDNAPTMLTFAKRFGAYSGAGKNQRLEFEGVSLKFGNQEQCIQTLREDSELMGGLWNYLIAQQASSLEMPREFIDRIMAMEH